MIHHSNQPRDWSNIDDEWFFEVGGRRYADPIGCFRSWSERRLGSVRTDYRPMICTDKYPAVDRESFQCGSLTPFQVFSEPSDRKPFGEVGRLGLLAIRHDPADNGRVEG